jgi:hypothetical protein
VLVNSDAIGSWAGYCCRSGENDYCWTSVSAHSCVLYCRTEVVVSATGAGYISATRKRAVLLLVGCSHSTFIKVYSLISDVGT